MSNDESVVNVRNYLVILDSVAHPLILRLQEMYSGLPLSLCGRQIVFELPLQSSDI